MRFSIQRVELPQAAVEKGNPVAVVDLSGGQNPSSSVSGEVGVVYNWRILRQHIEHATKTDAWLVEEKSNQAAVPMLRYRLASSEPAEMVRLGLQVGTWVPIAFTNMPRESVVYVLVGPVYAIDGHPGCDCWLGFAVRHPS